MDAARSREPLQDETNQRTAETSASEQNGYNFDTQAKPSWGVAGAERFGTMPYKVGKGHDTSNSFVPLLFFENDYMFLRGTEGGVYLYQSPDRVVQISGIGRLRFIDLPKDVQQSAQFDTLDFGLKLRYNTQNYGALDFAVLSDHAYRLYSALDWQKAYQLGAWQLTPKATLRYKDGDFNSYYYGLEPFYHEHFGGGFDVSAGLDARYHLGSNFYLLGAARITRLDQKAYRAEAIKARYEGEAWLGIGWFEEQLKGYKKSDDGSHYFRIAHGWATPSNLGDILQWKRDKDPDRHQMTSLFYGHRLVDDWFGLPLDIYFTPGLVHHWSTRNQTTSTEYVVALKAYYTFNWPTKWRIGAAEGMSYIDNGTRIEKADMEDKNYTLSRLLNYLDFSLDFNIGDLFNYDGLNSLWLGYSLHHRSGIFEKSSQYGRIKGGSNYNTVYLLYDF